MANSYNLNQKELTRRSIIEGLVSLLKRKPLERISISELCVRAGVSRVAFYRHFGNLPEVLKGYFADQRAELLSWMRQQPDLDLAELGGTFLRKVEQEKAVFNAVFKANLQWILVDYMASGIDLFRREFQPPAHEGELEREYLIAYEAGGLLSVISKWLARECRDSKEDILALLVDRYREGRL